MHSTNVELCNYSITEFVSNVLGHLSHYTDIFKEGLMKTMNVFRHFNLLAEIGTTDLV
jgi:hypothetical protein